MKWTRSNDKHRLRHEAVMHTSWLLDMYTCFRLLKPYDHHVIVVLGVDHIRQIQAFMRTIRVDVKTSPWFDQPTPQEPDLRHGAQCISIPTLGDGSLSFDDDIDLYAQAVHVYPAYQRVRVSGIKRKSKRRFRRSSQK